MSIDASDFDPFEWARRLHEWGSEDVAFDTLMALGPVIVFALVVGGRTLIPTALGVLYVGGFLVALAYNVAIYDRP